MAHETKLSEQASNVKFVYEVKKRPCLYNPDLMTYARKDITDEAWDEVGKIMNMSGSACKERWRNLRNVYTRYMKSGLSSGTGRRKRRYYLSDAMQFLLPYMKISSPAPPKASPKETEDEEKTFYHAYRLNEDDPSEETIPESWRVPVVKIERDDDQSCDTNQDSEGHSSRKRSVNENGQFNFRTAMDRAEQSTPCFVTDTDPVTSFLNSLVPELKEMKAAEFKSFKRRVLALIDDITEES